MLLTNQIAGFCKIYPADKHQLFQEVDSITLGVCSQSTQNNKFAISLQYVKENVKDEVDFSPVDKQRFLQIDTIILGVCGQACPNYPKQQVSYFFAMP